MEDIIFTCSVFTVLSTIFSVQALKKTEQQFKMCKHNKNPNTRLCLNPHLKQLGSAFTWKIITILNYCCLKTFFYVMSSADYTTT